ncbi:MAG: iron-regulated protein [Pelagibacterales bacterium]|nr:iron-regulated protein [Pelagibacterales bacterium]
MYKISSIILVKALLIFLFINKSTYAANNDYKSLANSYADLVSHYYNAVALSTKEMNDAIIKFIQAPDNNSLINAKNKWIEARIVYGITEAFRFYGGPIDGVNKYGEEGPEGLINAWPLNEAYIDYVQGNPESGIINNMSIEINAETIIAANMSEDDADVSTGWHAIEFLLWGQDFSLETAGIREASDYLPTNEVNVRRRAYLVATSTLLLEHVNWLAEQWSENGEGRKSFIAKEDPGGAILTGIATLAGFELSSERIATALDSGDPEDEHSCFSDQTHNDVKANFNGIKNVYLGKGQNGKSFKPSISEFVMENDIKLHENIMQVINTTDDTINNITVPFDKMLSEPINGLGRQAAEKTVSNLLVLAENFKEAGKNLNWNVIIAE